MDKSIVVNNHGAEVKEKVAPKRKNVEFSIEKDVLTIKVKLSKIDSLSASDLSTSGKTYLIASTGGNVTLPSEFRHLKLGLNVFASKSYVDGRNEIIRQQERWQESIYKVNEKDTKISVLEAEIAELKAMLKASLNK